MAAGTLKSLAEGSPLSLGVVRAVVHGAFLVGVVTTSFENLGSLPVTLLRPTGAMQLLPWGFYEALLTPGGMLALKVLMTAALLLGALGLWARWTTKLSAALVLFYEGLLRSFGHFNHDEMVAVYALVVLAFTPCADAFAVGRRNVESRRVGWAYGYPLLLVRMLLAWMYFSSALLKLRVAGLDYFSPDNLPALAVFHSLDNLHDTQYRLAFELVNYREYTTPFVLLVLLWELLFPLALFSRRARWWVLGFGLAFHVSTVFVMNIFFPYHLVMYLAFVDWRRAAARLGRRAAEY